MCTTLLKTHSSWQLNPSFSLRFATIFFSSCCFSVAIREAQLFSLNGLRETPLTHFGWFFPIVWSATCFRVLRLPKVDGAYLLLVYHEKICGTNALSVMEMGPL